MFDRAHRLLIRMLQVRALIWLAGGAVCVYVLAVLTYVQMIPDLGLKSAFNARLTFVRADNVIETLPKGMYPRKGDIVRVVGPKRINSWPDLLNAPVQIREELHSHPETNRSWAKSEQDQFLIRVQFTREKGEGEPVEFAAWMALRRLPVEEMLPALLWAFLKLLLFVVGVLVLWKRPNDPACVQFFVLCFVTLGAYIGGYLWPYLTTAPALVVGFMICAVLLPPVALHFYLVFPKPKPVWSRRRCLALVYTPALLLLATLLVEYFHLRWVYSQQTATEQLESALNTFLWTIYIAFGLAALWYLASTASLFHSWFRARDVMERNQVKCILVGAILSLAPIGYSLFLAVFRSEDFGAGAATWPMFAASVVVTAAFFVGITRYRLMELDQIISSSVRYFVFSFLVGLAYYAIVFLGTLTVTLLFNQVIASPPLIDVLKVSTVALVLMLVVDQARNRLRRALDRRFHRQKYHLDRTLQRMSQAVEQLVDPPTLVQRLLHSSADLMGVNRGAVFLRQEESATYRLAGWVGPAPGQAELAESDPLPSKLQTQTAVLVSPGATGIASRAEEQLFQLDGAMAYALLHEERLLAFLVFGPRTAGRFQQEDLNLLGAFAQITVLALVSAEGHDAIEQLNIDLQAKVQKISEQQRRIIALQSQLRKEGTAKRHRVSKQPISAANEKRLPDSATIPEAVPADPGNIIGSSRRIRQLLNMVRKVSQTNSVVLIRGESGTGKELLAEAIHRNSPRGDRAFVKVHCAALSPTLLESELFGHVKGAFTDAHRDKAGRFELADGGTLFLDEIGDISVEVQTKLLRVLQECTFERVGSNETIKVDVRILAATHQNLEDLMTQGRFREDLFYRLNVFPIVVPPLRLRREDIAELALHFLNLAAQRCDKHGLEIDDEALVVLKSYHWPGNIRQLENVIERTVVLMEGSTILPEDLPEEILAKRERGDSVPRKNGASSDARETATDAYRQLSPGARLERDLMLDALDEAGGNKALAARKLGIPRSTLVSRLKKYELL